MTEHKQKSVLSTAVAAGLARIVMDTASFPLDTLKTRLQAHYGRKDTLRQASQRSLYAGLSSQAIMAFPLSFTYFFAYENLKRRMSLKLPGSDPTPMVHLWSGVGAEVCTSVIRTPLETIKQQMQIGLDPSMRATCRSIFALRSASGFYQGYFSVLLKEIPYSAIQMPIYEMLKKLTRSARRPGVAEEPLSILENARNGMASGSLAAIVTHPMDVVKTKLMINREKEVMSYWQCVQRIYRADGFLGFYKGGLIRVANIAMLSVIFFSCYERILTRIDL